MISSNTSLRKDIESWIHEVSSVRPDLGGFAICPFAKKSSYEIIECPAKDIYLPEKSYDVLIYRIEDDLSLKEVQDWVQHYNIKYSHMKFFEDCASYDTYINQIRTNNGKYNLILAQSREKLKKFREILAKTNYYDYWDTNYLKEILDEDYNTILGIETP